MGAFVSGIATPYGLRFDPAGNLDVSSRTLGQIRTYNGSTGAYISTLVSGLTNPAYMTTTTSLVTTSAGGTANFSVTLNSQPTADVVITLASTNPFQGTLSQSILTFTNANWNVAQTVTVTGLNDGIPNGDQVYQINGIAVSADANYTGASMAPVVVTNREVAAPNTAPVLDPSASPVFATEIQNAGAPVGAVGTLVSTLVDFPGGGGLNNVTDPDAGAQLGIAVSGADTTNGSWWYSTNNGSTWISLGAVSGANARLLAADASSRLYFQPNANWIGTVPNAITFRAWDRTSGAAGGTANVTSNGGTTAFSTATDTASLTVNPAPGINVSAITGPTSEAGGTANFKVALNSQPTADVTIGLSSSNPAEGTVSTTSLTFTTANWNVDQTVTVTGVNDLVADGNVNYTILTATAVSSDGVYNNLNASDVMATNLDDDSPNIFVSAISGPTTEAGDSATFSVVLNSMPVADVTIGVTSSNPAEGTVSTSSLIFTAANWNVAQTVAVTGVDDAAVDGDIAYTIVTAPASSSDLTYNNLNPADVAAVNSDNDATGIIVTPTSGLVTSETGTTATFTVRLNSLPLLPVTIGISSSNPAEGAVSTSSLTFNLLNWNIPQTVTITGVDDFVADGNVGYTIVTAPASSLDFTYNGVNAPDVSVTNLDDDVGGVTVSAISGSTTETGGTATFTVVLNIQPTADVTIGLNSSNPAEGTPSTPSLTFTSANWNVAQTVTVTGGNDFVADGNVNYTIVAATAVSADLAYNGLDPTDVAVTNLDDDVVGINVSAISGPTTEAGGTATFSVTLNSQPTANVTIGISSSDTAEGTVSTALLTFTAANWSMVQTVTVTGVDDFVADGNINYTIVTAKARSGDSNYHELDVSNVAATNQDDDMAGINVSAISRPTTEAGGTAWFTVVLNSRPSANVRIGISSSNTSEGSVSTTSLTYTAANWNVARTVTVTGVDDVVIDGNVNYAIVTAPATSSDSGYNLLDANDVAVTNQDNDFAGIYVTPTAGLVTTPGGSANFSVVLTSQPTSTVTVTLTSSNPLAGTASQPSVAFTVADWDLAKTITVTSPSNPGVVGDLAFTIRLAPAVSADLAFNGRSGSDVALTLHVPSIPMPSTLIGSGILMPVPRLFPTPGSVNAVPGSNPLPATTSATMSVSPVSLITPNVRTGNESLESNTSAFLAQAAVAANRTIHVFAPVPQALWRPMQDLSATTIPEDTPPHAGLSRMQVLPATASQAQTAQADGQLDVLNDDGERMPWTEQGIESTLLVGTGVLASGGYVLLNSRLGLWLLGLLTARPLWKQFDPLEVLYAWEDDGRNCTIDDEDEETLMSLVN